MSPVEEFEESREALVVESNESREAQYWIDKLSKLLIEHQEREPFAVSMEKEIRLRSHDTLFWKCETFMLMHNLAYNYFWLRAFLINFLILLLGVIISVLGILTTGVPTDDDFGDIEENDFNFEDESISEGNTTATVTNDVTRLLNDAEANGSLVTTTHVIAILGIAITFVKSLEKYLSYQSRSDLHESAITTLQDICDQLLTVRLEIDRMCDFKDWVNQKGLKHFNDDIPSTEHFDKQKEYVKICKAKFDTMQKACTDPVPPEIVNKFVQMREVFKLAPYDMKYFLYRRYYHRLAQKLRRSALRFHPPLWLMCFDVDDIYRDLYYDVKAFIKKWMGEDGLWTNRKEENAKYEDLELYERLIGDKRKPQNANVQESKSDDNIERDEKPQNANGEDMELYNRLIGDKKQQNVNFEESKSDDNIERDEKPQNANGEESKEEEIKFEHPTV